MVYWVASAIVGLVLIGFALIAYCLRNSKSGSLARFVFRYLLIFVFFLLFEALIIGSAPWVHETLSSMTAGVMVGTLRPLGIEASSSASLLSVQDPYLLFDISISCLGGLLLWIYIGLVWAETGLTARQRLIGIVAGVPLLIAFNFFRIFSTIYVEWAFGPQIHDLLYFLNLVFVIIAWMLWFHSIRKKPSFQPASQPLENVHLSNEVTTSPTSRSMALTGKWTGTARKHGKNILTNYQPLNDPPEQSGNGRH